MAVARPLLLALVIAAALAQTAAAQPPDFVPGSWTLAVLPDIHYGQGTYERPWVEAQFQWLAANKDTYNIQFVLQEGDLTHYNDHAGWTYASNAFAVLDDVNLPYAIATGNHDYGMLGGAQSRDTLFNSYFPVTSQQAKPTFGGTFEPNKMDNSYHLFSAGGTDYVALALEFGPRDEVVTWADTILTQHSDRTGILVTHAYLYSDDTRYDWATQGASQLWNPHSYPLAALPGGVNDGQELWDELVKKHENMEWVFNGHVVNDGAARLDSAGENANTVHQILANFQAGVVGFTGQEGYLRLLEFRPDGCVQVKTYSPYLGWYLTSPAHQFLICPRCPGDANEDGLVDTQDFSILKAHFGQAGGWGEGNFNADNIVDTQDLAILKAHFGQSSSTANPEPGTFALLVLGAVGLLARRKRRSRRT